MRKAEFWTALPRAAQCNLCERQCVLGEAACGPCGVREFGDGALWTRADERLVSVVTRPIEALGLYHVLPASRALAVSFADGPTADGRSARAHVPVDALPDLAARAEATTVAFGRSEPLWHFEALLPALQAVHRAGCLTALQTRGRATAAAFARLAPWLDAVSLDLPTLVAATAQRIDGVPVHRLREVLAELRRNDVWVEVTTLLAPGINDSARELGEIAGSLRDLDPKIPWHVRCVPTDERTLARWAEAALARVLDVAGQAGLEYVYAAEAPGSDRELTFCHVCRDVLLIERYLGQPRVHLAAGRRCPRCHTEACGIFARRERVAALS